MQADDVARLEQIRQRRPFDVLVVGEVARTRGEDPAEPECCEELGYAPSDTSVSG